MKNWLSRAMDFLKASLEPPRHELNELDWKAALSPDKKRLSEHLSALANLPGGGFLVFGVNNAGTAVGVERLNVEPILKMLERPLPTSAAETMIWMAGENFVDRVSSGGGYVTNLGAVAAASKLEDFPDLPVEAIEGAVEEKLGARRSGHGLRRVATATFRRATSPICVLRDSDFPCIWIP
jgi:hypothetical protein